MTLEQAKTLKYDQELHCTVVRSCEVTVGPRGGVDERIVRVRVSGSVQTWKRDSGRVRVPVKYGLYESSAITESNLDSFHFASECRPRETVIVPAKRVRRVTCDQCAIVSINGVACHEHGCPNRTRR